MKLHLPLLLRKALIALYSVTLSAGFKTLASSYTIYKGSESTRVDSFEISGVLDGGDLLQAEGVSCKAATISGSAFHGNVSNITNSTLKLSNSIVLTCYASSGSIMNSSAVSPIVGFTQFGHIDDLTVTCTTFNLSMSDSVKNLTLNMQAPNSAASIGNVNTLECVRASGNTTSGANVSIGFSNVKNCTDVNLTNLMTSFYYGGVVTNFSLSDGHGFYTAYGTKFKGDFRVIGNKPEAAQENSSKPLLIVLDSNGFLDGATGCISDCSVYMHSNISKGAASLLSLDEKGFWIQNNDIIIIGGYDDDAYSNKQFAYIVESKGDLNILNNKQVAISGNSLAVGENAAAIFVSPSTGGTANLYIRGNEQVEISSNLVESGEIIPYSIMSTSGNVFLDTMPQNPSTLSTADSAASSYIKLYQPIYVAGSLALNYNEGVGEILISGEYIDSYMAQQGSKDAKKEIREKNRTSLVMGNVDLQSGSLTIADTAILKIANKSQSSQSESENNRFSRLSIRDGATLSVEYAGISTDGTKYESVPALSVGYLNLDNNSNMEIYTSSNIGELKIPIIKLSDFLSINEDVALTVVNTGNDFKSGELRPLLEVPMVALGKQDANGGVKAYGFASKIKGAPIMEHISWTSVNESSKTQGFSYRSEKGTLDEKVELTWVNDILYIKSKEDGFWLKNTNETRSNLLDSDKTFDSDGAVKDEINASGNIVSDMSCYVHVAKNLIDVFQSRGGYLLSANNSILPATDITNLKKIFRYKAGKAGSWPTVVNYYFSGANTGAVTFHRKGQSGLFKVQADVFREVNNEFPAPVKDIMTLTEQMKTRLERGFSPIALSFGTSPTEKITEGNTTIYKYKDAGHAVTCWGYEEFTTPVTSDKYLVLYVTDSDTEPHNGKAYSEIWCEQDDTGLKIVHYNGLNSSQENFYIRDIGSVNTTSTTLDEAIRLYESTSNAMIRTGESGVWTATSLSDSLSGTSIPADWVKYVGDNTWVKADFYDDSVENPAEDTIAFAESETSFRFVDSIDGVSLPYDHRDITLIGDLGVQKVTIEGDNYVFGGTGSLTSTDVTVTGSLTLDDTVQIRHTPISIYGGLLNAYVKDQITIEGGSIQLSSNGTLHCAGFAYEQGEYLLTSCSLQAVSVHSDGSGVLQATMDFGGQSIELSTINALSDNEELNKLFHASVNAVDGIDSFTYRYEAANADIEATAASLSQQHIGLKTCSLSINADDTAQVTIGSYFASVDESAASVSLSEQDGGTIKSGQTKLSTVQGERVYFHSAVNVGTSQLTVSQNSSLINDGLIVGENAAAGIVVESQAQLGGCGHFSSTLVKSGGVLHVGEGLGNPVYDALIMQSGSCLIFGVDGMSPASSAKRGWGSGAHSVLTVNGNFSIQEGVTVQLGCSLDFLNASSLGNTHTLTLIQMANAASEDVLQTLMSGTEFLWADYDTLAAISEVGASIHDYTWHMGENNEIQLSFVVSSCPAESLRWSADAPSQVWDEVSRNWVDASGNQLAYERGKPVLFYDGATVEIRGEHVPEKVIVSSSEDVTFIGSGNIGGKCELIKEGSGELTINTENAYSGGTSIIGGRLVAANSNALGAGGVIIRNAALNIAADGIENAIITEGEAWLTVENNNTLVLSDSILNDGTLTLKGTLDVSALVGEIDASESGRLDINGNVGDNGFASSTEISVAVVDGGTIVDDGVEILAHGTVLTLGADGIASNGGGTNYAEYLVTAGHEVSASAVHTASKGALRQITLNDGVLNADASVKVAATGGEINLSDGTLSGTISGTALNVSGGSLSAQLSGSNALAASNWTMQQTISNSGNLALTGTLDASALQKQLTGVEVRVDENGNAGGQSGFLRSGDFTVTVAGGTVDSTGATVSYGGQTLSMNGGTGSGLGEVQLGTYLLAGNDTATVSKIQTKAGNALQKIDMQGGTLNVDASTDALVATAGQVNLSDGTLGGSLGGSAAVAVSGSATITGSNSYSGGTSLSNAQLTITNASALGTGGIATSGTSSLVVEGVTLELSGTIVNSGKLILSGNFDASALNRVSGEDTYIDVMGKETTAGSGFVRIGDFTVTIAEGTVDSSAAKVTYMNTELAMDGGVGSGTALTDFTTYRILDAHEVSASAVKAASKVALQQITQSGGVLNADASVKVAATGGEINLSDGTLSGTISGTALNVSGGSLSAQLSGSNTLAANNWTMQQSIANTGNLTLTGTLDASALQKQLTGVEVRVDENGNAGGQSGFLRSGDFTVTVAGGTVDSTGATVSYGGQTLSMNGGTGSGLGEVQLGTYLLTGNDSATVSRIQAKAGNALQKIDMQAGTLNVDASTDALVATAGQVNLSAGTLGGSLSGSAAVAVSGTATITGTNSYSGGTSLSNAQLTITNASSLGTGGITASGTSSLIIESVALKLGSTIANEGTLSLSGCIDASNLELVRTEEGRLSLDGREVALTESGFASAAAYHVNLVKGGNIVNDCVVVLHDEYLTRARLELGSDGVARAGGGVDYRRYYLTGSDTVKVSDIAAVSSRNQATLDGVSMDSGTLTVDENMAVMAGGGNIHITDDAVLSGSINQTAVTTAAGDYTGEIEASLAGDTTLVVNGGHITVSGANSYSGGTTVNGGTLQAGHRAAFGAGEVTVNDATLDLNSFTIANKIQLNGNSTLAHAAGASNLVLGKGASVNFREAYTLGRGETLEVADSGAVYKGALTLGGGILDLDGKLTVQGDVTFESGTQTTLDLSGWANADDGEVLADFGSNCSGYTEGSLKLSGIAGFWNLEFDPVTGTLSLAAVRDASLLNLNRNQTAVYNTIRNYGAPAGLLGELAKNIMDSRDEAQIKQLLDELGGAEYATLMSGQQAAASGHMRRLRGEMGSDHQLVGTKTRAYVEAYNHRSELDADACGRGYELNESGGQFALEFIGESRTSGGFAVAAGRTKLQPDGGLTQKSDNTYVDAFVLHRNGSYTGKFSLGVGVHKYDLERRVAGNPVGADTDGSSVNFMHESAYAMSLAESHSVQVFGAVESCFNKLGAFHEKGADTASLQVESQDAWVTTLSVGARYLYSFDAVNSAPAATLSVQGGLEFDFGDTDSEVEMNFEGARGHSFRQSGAERDTFGYNLGASLHLPVSTKAAIYASGDAVLRGNSYEVNANVGLQVAF